MKKPTVTIVKGKDSYIEMTPLAEYCLQQGFVIVREEVNIEMPKGKELLRFNRDVKDGKIKIVE